MGGSCRIKRVLEISRNLFQWTYSLKYTVTQRCVVPKVCTYRCDTTMRGMGRGFCCIVRKVNGDAHKHMSTASGFFGIGYLAIYPYLGNFRNRKQVPC